MLDEFWSSKRDFAQMKLGYWLPPLLGLRSIPRTRRSYFHFLWISYIAIWKKITSWWCVYLPNMHIMVDIFSWLNLIKSRWSVKKVFISCHSYNYMVSLEVSQCCIVRTYQAEKRLWYLRKLLHNRSYGFVTGVRSV